MIGDIDEFASRVRLLWRTGSEDATIAADTADERFNRIPLGVNDKGPSDPHNVSMSEDKAEELSGPTVPDGTMLLGHARGITGALVRRSYISCSRRLASASGW
jgi:hypothetical protein